VPGGQPGERGFLPVPVVGVEPFLGLIRRKDQLVAAAERHERGPVLPHLPPPLLDLLRVAEDQFGPFRRQFQAGSASSPRLSTRRTASGSTWTGGQATSTWLGLIA
jgi:hypothetical protein